MNKYLILLALLLLPITSAAVGYGGIDYGVSWQPTPIDFNNNTAFVNQSAHWVTLSLGTLDDVNTAQFNNVAETLTIDPLYIDANWCALTGCTMEGDIDVDDSNILFTNSGAGIQRVINASSTNPSGVIGYELNNDVGSSIALSIAGSSIADFANDSGIISRGGKTFIVNAADKDIIMGHGELPNVNFTWMLSPDGTVTQTGDLVMNGSAIFLDGNQRHFIKENSLGFPFNGISNEAEWFGHNDFDEDGEITFLFTHGNDTNLWMQSGKNNSFSSIGNSFFVVPTYMANDNFTENGVINMTKASSYLILCDTFGIDCNFNADTRGNAIDSIPGGPLLGTMGDLEVWQSAKIHDGLSVEGPIFFDLEGNNANFNNGTVHIATGVTFEEGFSAGESVTKFTETFASGLGIFINIQSDLGNWVNVLNSVMCDEGECADGDGAGSGLVEMQTNFSTSDINETTLSFVYSLVNLIGAGEFSIEVNNNIGSGDVEIFSDTTTSVIKSSEFIALPSSMDDQPLVTLTVICDIGSSNKPTRQCFFDTAKINGTAISTTLINVSGFNSIIAFSDGTLDADGFPERGIIYNASNDQIIFRGNVTFENIIEQDLNITNSISLNGTTIFDWGNIPDFVPYVGANRTVNLGANNLIVNTDTLFVDSATSRVGIGTNSPAFAVNAKGLDIAGTGGILNNPQDGTERIPTLRITDTVIDYGSGTATIGEVRGAIEFYSSETTNNYPAVAAAIKVINEGNRNDRHGLAFYTNVNAAIPTERIRIDNEGNFGIGTSSPLAKLDVNGSVIIADGLIVDTDTLFVDSFNNRIGIGTTSPTSELTIGDSTITTNPKISISGFRTAEAGTRNAQIFINTDGQLELTGSFRNKNIIVPANTAIEALGSDVLFIGNTIGGIFSVGGGGSTSELKAKDNNLLFGWERVSSGISQRLRFSGNDADGDHLYLDMEGLNGARVNTFYAETSDFRGSVNVVSDLILPGGVIEIVDDAINSLVLGTTGVEYINIDTSSAGRTMDFGGSVHNPEFFFRGSGDVNINNLILAEEGRFGVPTNPNLFELGGLSVSVNVDFNVDGDTLFVDASSDRVGIGKFSPNFKLDVAGDGNFDSNLTAANFSTEGGLALTSPINQDTITLKMFEEAFQTSSTISIGNDGTSADAVLVVKNTGHGNSVINQDVSTFSTDMQVSGLTVTGANGFTSSKIELTGSVTGFNDEVLSAQATIGTTGFGVDGANADMINFIGAKGGDSFGGTIAGNGTSFIIDLSSATKGIGQTGNSDGFDGFFQLIGHSIFNGFFDFFGDMFIDGDLNITGNTTTNDRYFLGNGASIGYNATCEMIFYNSTGGVMSTLEC